MFDLFDSFLMDAIWKYLDKYYVQILYMSCLIHPFLPSFSFKYHLTSFPLSGDALILSAVKKIFSWLHGAEICKIVGRNSAKHDRTWTILSYFIMLSKSHVLVPCPTTELETNKKITWAMTKAVRLGYIGIMPPSYVWIVLNHYKDPLFSTSIMESKVAFSVTQILR